MLHEHYEKEFLSAVGIALDFCGLHCWIIFQQRLFISSLLRHGYQKALPPVGLDKYGTHP